MTVATVPLIQQQPRTVADTAIHYGYTAFKSIIVADRFVQPRHAEQASPYWKEMPCRQLIPFTNIEVPEPIAEVTAGTSFIRTSAQTVNFVPKSAKECAEELAWSYGDKGFRILSPLTGYQEMDAFSVFQTIQPFAYKLSDIEEGLSGAENRIAQTKPYEVTYDGETVTLEPLAKDLKEIALRTLAIIRESAQTAVTKGQETITKTVQSMEQYYSTGLGKRAVDPHDLYVFAEMNETLPQLVAANKKNTPQGDSQESIDLKRRELELREKEYELRLRELEAKKK